MHPNKQKHDCQDITSVNNKPNLKENQNHADSKARDCESPFPSGIGQLGGSSPSSSELEEEDESGPDSSESEESWPGKSKHFLQRLCIGARIGTRKKRAVPYRHPHGVRQRSG